MTSVADDRAVNDALAGTLDDREAEDRPESEPSAGLPVTTYGGATVRCSVTETGRGRPSRYIDKQTELMGALAATWYDFQQMRKAADQRGLSEADVEAMQKAETYFANRLVKAFHKHPLWPFVSQYRGLGGVHTARLIARIGDPRRFPGQQCDQGHTFAPTAELSSNEDVACPFVDTTTGEVCPGRLLPPRTTTGTRALWRYLGLDGPRATAASGHRYDRLGKTALLQPGGIAEQIVRAGTPVYRDIYDQTKARLQATRGAAPVPESVPPRGSTGLEGPQSDQAPASETAGGLRPFQIDAIARKVAAKAFVADLLHEWKRVTAEDSESESCSGHAQPPDDEEES